MNPDEALVEMDRQLELGVELTGPAELVFAAALHGLPARSCVGDWHSRGSGFKRYEEDGSGGGAGGGRSFGLGEGGGTGDGDGFGLGYSSGRGHGWGVGVGYGCARGQGDGHGRASLPLAWIRRGDGHDQG